MAEDTGWGQSRKPAKDRGQMLYGSCANKAILFQTTFIGLAKFLIEFLETFFSYRNNIGSEFRARVCTSGAAGGAVQLWGTKPMNIGGEEETTAE